MISLVAALLLVAQPETRGPYTVGEQDLGSLSLAGANIRTVLYYPTDRPTPAPIVAVIHGFLRNGRFMAEMGRTFASRGFVALVPDMPCGLGGCNHDENADQILALLEYGAAQNTVQSSPIFGKVDPLKRGAVGHSWGALSTFLTSARASELDVAVLLDPQDDMGRAAQAAASVTVPTAHIVAEVIGACNNTWGPVFPASPEPRMRIRVVDSAHCDVEEPSDNLCPLGCGRGDPSKSSVFRRYAISWVGCVLEPSAFYAEYVGGALFQADVAAGLIDQEEIGGADRLPCNNLAAPDAGVVEDAASMDGAPGDGGAIAADTGTIAGDAGFPDSGGFDGANDFEVGFLDAAAGVDAPLIGADALEGHLDRGPGAAPAADESCGCSTARQGQKSLLLPLLFGTLLLARRKRC